MLSHQKRREHTKSLKQKNLKHHISLQCIENVISLWLSRYSCKNLNGKGYVINSSHCPKPTVSIFFNSKTRFFRIQERRLSEKPYFMHHMGKIFPHICF